MTARAVVDFGRDLSCASDLDPAMVEVTDLEIVAQATFRRLSTPNGALWDDPDYGFDLRELLSLEQTPAEMATIPGRVRNEVAKDQRIDSASVQVLSVSLLEILIGISCQTGAGPFSLVISASEAAVVLVSANVRQAA